MNRTAKAEWRENIVSALNKSTSIFLASYSGMTVEELSSFRRDLKLVNADFHVVKNTIVRKAMEGREEAVIVNLFKGQTGVVFTYGDVGAAAKTVSQSTKKYENFKLIGGYLEGALLDNSAIGKISELPSREVLIAKILGALTAPHRNLLSVLNFASRDIIQVLHAIKEKKVS